MSEHDDKIIEALEASGRPEMAKQIRDERLTKELADSGRGDMADKLTGTPTEDEAPGDEGAEFIEQLRTALKGNKVSLPGLLDQ